MQISKQEATWLVEEFNPMRGLKIDKTTIPKFIKAINIIMEQNRRIPSCGCEFKVTAQIANSAYNQFETEILAVYNKPTRGRKKK
jgi:hypothetical protein